MDPAAYFSGEEPRDKVRTVKAICSLRVKYRRLPNASLYGKLQEVLAGLSEEPTMAAENFKRIEAME